MEQNKIPFLMVFVNGGGADRLDRKTYLALVGEVYFAILNK